MEMYFKEPTKELAERQKIYLIGIIINFIVLLIFIFSIVIYHVVIKEFIKRYPFPGLFFVIIFLLVLTLLLFQFFLYGNEMPILIIKDRQNYYINIKNKTINVKDVDYYQDTFLPYLLLHKNKPKLRRKIRVITLGKNTKEMIESIIPNKNIHR